MKTRNIIFLPSLMCTDAMYMKQFESLKGSKKVSVSIHSFIITDLSTIEKAAEFILTEIKKLQISKFYLVGTSLGGYIAMEIIRQNASMVQKVCLINTTWYEDTLEKKQSRINIINNLETIQDKDFIGITDKAISSYIVNKTIYKVDLLKTMAKQIGRSGLINQHKIALSRISYKDTMMNSNIPCLIIGAQHDNITPPEIHKEMQQLIPFSKLYIIDNCSHLSPIDAPDEVGNILLKWCEE